MFLNKRGQRQSTLRCINMFNTYKIRPKSMFCPLKPKISHGICVHMPDSCRLKKWTFKHWHCTNWRSLILWNVSCTCTVLESHHDEWDIVTLSNNCDNLQHYLGPLLLTWLNTLRQNTLTQNGCHYTDYIFKCIFFWMKMYGFWLRFHWMLFQRVQLTIFKQWFR